jgi:lipopolysaccharide heptosyltransferase I
MMRRLLIVRLGSLGDLVHTLPAAAALRDAHPAADIDWLVDATHREFLELVPVLSSIVTLRDRTAIAWYAARAELRARAYDAALDFQGLLKSAALAWISGARRVLGFDRESLRERTAAPFYTERVAVGETGHVIHKNLRLAAAVGARTDRVQFPLRVPEPAVASRAEQHAEPFALLNPGAAWPNKRWPPDRFGRIARHVRDRHGLAAVILWGPGERPLAEAVAAASAGAATIAPETSIADLVTLMRRARLMVSGDTGPTHIAAALDVPIVALFGPTNPERNGPWSPADITLSGYEACVCHYERRCRLPNAEWCLGRIPLEDVTAAIDRRLAG